MMELMPNDCTRAFTVRGSSVGEAMLSGAKPLETRAHKWWPPGWYNLHIATTKTKHVNEISAAIIGHVLLGKVVNATDVDHEWKVESAGAYCYIIVASREFREPVRPVRGNRGLWYISCHSTA